MTPRYRRVVAVRGAGLFGNAARDRRETLSVGQPLVLLREPANPADPCAVAVYDLLGGAVGYVQREAAPEVASRLDSGEVLLAVVWRRPYLDPGPPAGRVFDALIRSDGERLRPAARRVVRRVYGEVERV